MTKGKRNALILRALVYIGVGFTAVVFFGLVLYILIRGIPNLSWGLFAWEYNTNNASMMPALINTVTMTLLSLLVAVPIGVYGAIYMTEYASSDSRLVRVVRITSETLTGIPSILYGLFGLMFFVTALKLGLSLISGALTLSIMILPLILRATEEALMAVPREFREGSFGLGAGRLRTVSKVVLPSAMPGILSGVILAIGRIVGETAALIYTAGTVAKAADSLSDSARTLSVHMYALSSEGLYVNQASATAAVLLILVVGINALSGWTAKRLTRR
jgi:phosphate transport system permease protein